MTLRFLGIVKTNYNIGINGRVYLTVIHPEPHFFTLLSRTGFRVAEQIILDSKDMTHFVPYPLVSISSLPCTQRLATTGNSHEKNLKI